MTGSTMTAVPDFLNVSKIVPRCPPDRHCLKTTVNGAKLQIHGGPVIRDTAHFRRQIQKSIAGKTGMSGEQGGRQGQHWRPMAEYRQGNGQRTAAKAGQIVNGSDAGCGQSDPSFPCE